MIRINSFPYEQEPWGSAVDEEEETKLWVVNQLMGETEKGDSFEFAYIREDGIELYTGVLTDRNGEVKKLIPAVFAWKHDGVWSQVNYNGEVIDIDDNVAAAWRKVADNVDIDQVVKEWLEAEKQPHLKTLRNAKNH